VLAATVTIVTAIAVEVAAASFAGSPVAAERIDPAAGGVPISTVPLSPGAAAELTGNDRDVGAVLADLEDFWSAHGLPGSARPAGGYVAMDSSVGTAGGSAIDSALCIQEPAQIAGNAFYCPQGDGIVFDSAALVPVLLGQYGPAALATAFAHEFAHSVQARIGPTAADRRTNPSRYPSILIEAQADCDAGAFLAWAVAGEASRVRVPAGSVLRAITPVLDFRDPVTLSPSDPTAHGLGLDRLTFLLRGYRDGADACHTLTVDDLDLTLGRAGVVGRPSIQPRFASTDQALAAAAASVADFVGAAGLPNAAAPTTADQADLTAAQPYGQFAAATAAALATGRAVTGTDTGAACFAGAWVASLFGKAEADQLGSWPGDADEALDLIRSRPGATFEQVAGYADGFRQGLGACG
jgi:predicted metalloprotease